MTRAAAVRTSIVRNEAELAPWLDAWDELAIRAGCPYMTPAWTLAWWHHVRPRRSALRTVVVTRGDDLIGLAPLFADRGRPAMYRMLGLPFDAPKEPLARVGEEALVAGEIGEALARADPPADALRVPSLRMDGAWRPALASAGSRAYVFDGRTRPLPFLTLVEPSYEDWFASKSRNFRQQMRRARRRLESDGGVLSLASTAEAAIERVRPMLQLHTSRWEARGGSSVTRRGLDDMLAEAIERSGVPSRARLWSIEVDGRIISAHLFFVAGGRSSYWLGGFDDAYDALHPGMLCLLAEVEHAFSVGEHVVDLGVGRQPYKERLTSSVAVLTPATFVFRGSGYVRRRVVMAPYEAVATATARLPQSWRHRLRRARAVLRSRGRGA